MVDWVVDAVKAAGATDVKAIVSSHHAEVAAHLDGQAEVIYQREPEGTGHAVQQVPPEVLSRGDVLIVNADSPLLSAESIRKVIDAHRSSGAEATIASVDDARRDDGRIVRGPDGGFERIVEKKDATAGDRSGSEINVGLYCFQGKPLVEALGKITKDNQAGELYLPDVLKHLRTVNVVRIDDRDEAMGINDRAGLAQAIAAMRGRILNGHMAAGVTVTDPASTFIDAKVRIGQDTVIDQDVHIGSFAELVRTTVGRGSKVPHVSYLGDTSVGEDANVGAGTITANFNGEVKNKTQIGDGAFVGVDTMLVAPVKLGKGSRTGAGSVVTKDVPDGATAVGVPARVVRRKTVSSDHR